MVGVPVGLHPPREAHAFNTLVHNPEGVGQFVETMRRVAVSGVVDKRIIPGLAHDADHNEVGLFLHLDVYCAL